jgi:hypothetical protein
MRTLFAIAVGAVVLALMPAPPEAEREKLSLVTPGLTAICNEKFRVCETAAHAAESLEAKARFGAHIIIEWASTASGRIDAKLPADLA